MSKTNWIIITGCAGSGKTTIINELSSRGYITSPEASTLHIDQKVSEGFDEEEIKCTEDFQDAVEQVNRELEFKIPNDLRLISDRSILDNVAYRSYGTGVWDDQLIEQVGKRYKQVFMLEKLPLEKTDRDEPNERAEEITKKLRKIYEDSGHEIIDVPYMEVDKRADFIVDRIEAEPIW